MVLCAALAVQAPSVLAQRNDSLIILFPLQGDLSLRFEDVDTSVRGTSSDWDESYYYDEEELNLRQRLFIFDERFIDLTLGVGLILREGHEDRADEERELGTYDLSAIILKEKPVSFNVYTAKSELEFRPSPTQVVLEDRTREGVGVLAHESTGLPMPISLRYDKLERSFDNRERPLQDVPNQILAIEESTRTAEISSRGVWPGLRLEWELKRQAVDSFRASGGLSTERQYERSLAYLNGSGTGGPYDRLSWQISAQRDTQTGFAESERTSVAGGSNFTLIDGWSQALSAGVNASRSRAEQKDVPGSEFVESRTAGVSLHHRLYKSLYTDVTATDRERNYPNHSDTEEERGLRARYTKSIPDGQVNATYGVTTLSIESQGEQTLTAIDEPHTLTRGTRERLGAENIIRSTIVVTDELKVITYVENQDYLITQLGPDTFIEILGPAIADGQVVLVSYQFLSPAANLTRRTTSYGLAVRWYFVEPYAQHARTTETTTGASDISALTANPGTTDIYGVKLSDRLWQTVTPEAKFENERNRYRLDPFNRQTREVQVGFILGVGFGTLVYWMQETIDHLEQAGDTERENLGTDFGYTREKLRVDFRVQRGEDRVDEINHQLDSREAQLTTWYGKWVLQVTLRSARDRWSDVAAPGETYTRDFYAATLGLTRVF